MGWPFGNESNEENTPSDQIGASLMGRAETFQKDVDSMLSQVTRMTLPLQRQSFACCVNCFDTSDENLERIGDCVKQCQAKPEKFGNAVQTELNQLQDLLLSCQQKCFDTYSAKSGSGTTAAEMERCAIKCYDNNQSAIAEIATRLRNGKAKKTRKFAQVKRRMNPKDPKIALNKPVSKQTKENTGPLSEGPQVHYGMFFNYNENLVPPYQVIVDTNFINASIQNKLDLHKAMIDCLIAKCIIYVTDCVIGELEKLGHRYRLALQLAKDPRVNRLTCTHTGTYADDCIVERVMQHKCYIVATNDVDLKRRIRRIPGVPIMYVANHKYAIERIPMSITGK
ncbi:bifunctional rRNA-processing protein Fcf1 [Babesia duncani]|uniref:Bifunctional rRNA-processing protein Fcf1 n=1 Tax=Babesia duncani TaxID=323732 RepID=A0AAD9UN66_9APIC|nr:bifunctional rRNA-processing protein Fcf1 [Babesia duncani]